ncbi:MAG TPA: hypothetical protein VJR89_08590, partial [Polyangiales bacterium]|nr:hypothetical protein [Polyangiales bacterium]
DVYALAVRGADSVYAGGTFANIGSTPTARANLAEIDENGAVTGFAPAPDDDVRALTIADGNLYVGGDFLNVAGPQSRNRAAAYDNTNALIATWFPNVEGSVRSIAVTGDAVYLGGVFSRVDQVYSPNYAKYVKAEP